jgi:hypothetical protein
MPYVRKALIHVLRHGGPWPQEQVVEALLQLAWNSRNRAAIWEIIQPLIQVSLDDGSQGPLTKAKQALPQLARNSERLTWGNQNADELREEGVIEALIQVLREGSPKTQARAAVALTGLARNGQNADLIRAEGGIPALIQVLREGCQETQVKVVMALSVLALWNSKNRDAIRQAGGIQALIRVFHEGSYQTQNLVAMPLSALAGNEGSRHIISKNGLDIKSLRKQGRFLTFVLQAAFMVGRVKGLQEDLYGRIRQWSQVFFSCGREPERELKLDSTMAERRDQQRNVAVFMVTTVGGIGACITFMNSWRWCHSMPRAILQPLLVP